jgi:hypothetical protein
VQLNGAALKIDSFSIAQIVATLPANTVAGSYRLTVTNSQGAATVFDLTYGARARRDRWGRKGPQEQRVLQGATGQAGLTGATGPQGPKGPAGAPGGVLSYSTNGVISAQLGNDYGRVSVVTLKNPGTYILTGQITLYETAPDTINIACVVMDADNNIQQTSPGSFGLLQPVAGKATLPVNGTWVSTAANTQIWLECAAVGGNTYVGGFGAGAFTAIQVQ